MHVGALTVFEGDRFFDDKGRFRIADARALVSSRLHLIPRFRKKIARVPLDAGLPSPGSRSELLALFERVQAQMLDRSRPLWELWFVEGLEGNHVALFQKTHHSLVDGVSGVDVATVLLDFEQEPTPVDTPEWRPEAAPPPARLLVDTLKEYVDGPRALAQTARNAVEVPRRAADTIAQFARSLSTLTDNGLVAPRTSLNRAVGRNRRFGLVRLSLDDVKDVRRAFGGTLNDVVLAGVAGGVARVLESRGELTPELTLKICCPVSVRADSEHMTLGNRVSAMFVPIPVGEPDPLERLSAISASTADLKEREQPVAANVLLNLADYGAPTLLGLAARAGHHQPFFNFICTNVPGPQTPLYCMGARMLEAYPMVPLTKNTNIGIAILSYCGQLHLGLYADRDQWPDLEVLEAGIDDAFSELHKLASERGQAEQGEPAEHA
jgi:diacylglycerol O-acyltransferase